MSARRVMVMAAVAAVVAAAVLYPTGFLAVQTVRGFGEAGGEMPKIARATSWGLLARTMGVAGLIAVLATALAVPVAWWARAVGTRRLLFLLIPLLLPSYLAYSGWGLLRAPGTMIGDWLLRGAGGDGINWPVVAGRVLAVAGLVLWVWPLAFIVMAVRVRRLDPWSLEAMRLSRASRVRKAVAALGMIRGSVLSALGLVWLLMLGSAVPLHVAQFDTYAITIWRALDETPHARHWAVWVRAWPLLAIAAVAAGLITVWATGPAAAGEAERPHPRGRGLSGAGVWAAALWCSSVAVPVVLFAMSLRSTRSLLTFWRVTGDAAAESLGVAVAVAVVAVFLVAAFWYVASGPISRGRRGIFVPAALMVLLVAGLTPGVLVGSVLARAYNASEWVAWVGDSHAVVVLGHLARFGFIPALAGLLLARTEAASLRDLRILESGDSLRGWMRAALPPQLGAVLGVGIIVGLLSFQEIEATVLLSPPSVAGGSFAQRMLQHLHFARMEDLSAGVLLVTGAGLAVCAGVVWLWPRRKP